MRRPDLSPASARKSERQLALQRILAPLAGKRRVISLRFMDTQIGLERACVETEKIFRRMSVSRCRAAFVLIEIGLRSHSGLRTASDTKKHRESREVKVVRDYSEVRENKDLKNDRNIREHRELVDIRDIRDNRQSKDERKLRDNKNLKDARDARDQRDYKDYRELREYREPKDAIDLKNSRNLRGTQDVIPVREHSDYRETKDYQDLREKREYRNFREFGETEALKSGEETQKKKEVDAFRDADGGSNGNLRGIGRENVALEKGAGKVVQAVERATFRTLHDSMTQLEQVEPRVVPNNENLSSVGGNRASELERLATKLLADIETRQADDLAAERARKLTFRRLLPAQVLLESPFIPETNQKFHLGPEASDPPGRLEKPFLLFLDYLSSKVSVRFKAAAFQEIRERIVLKARAKNTLALLQAKTRLKLKTSFESLSQFRFQSPRFMSPPKREVLPPNDFFYVNIEEEYLARVSETFNLSASVGKLSRAPSKMEI